jgi:multimeric flavodoxin WrbA
MSMNKKIIGLSCGRKKGNSEILLKEALMSAEKIDPGISTEIIRAMDLRIKPCKGCQACGGPGKESKDMKCIIKDDDVEWILEKTMVEDAALIISFPVYHLQVNAHLKMITDRMNHIFVRDMNVLKKNRIGALISVGGSGPDWTSLALLTANIFLLHTRILVDQMQVTRAPLPGDVLAMDSALESARKLGQNVARSLLLPVEQVKYLGEESDVACPVCHCNLLHIPDHLPQVYCPVCWVRGELLSAGSKMSVKWNLEDARYPRFSIEAHLAHFKDGDQVREKLYSENKEKYENKSELIKKYLLYGNIVKPPSGI